MYIDYSNLWKLLAEKGVSKSDLIHLTGLSSRIIAKLAKNETVTTETISRICTALSCGVADIMECRQERNLSLYHALRTLGTVVEEGETFSKTTFTLNQQQYVVYQSKKTATKATHIHCEPDNTLYWKQHYMMGGPCAPRIEQTVLVKPERLANEIAIVVIKGKPGMITGLDEGIWVSAKKGTLRNDKEIFVMSEAVFKLFTL